MGIFNFLSSKERKVDIISSIFNVAEKGMDNINFTVTPAGRFEILMFDIWLGTRILEEERIHIDYMIMQDRIEEYLIASIRKLGLDTEKKYERLYLFRQEGWEHDIIGLLRSDYPKTKQFLPGYMHLCIAANPLVVYNNEATSKRIQEIPLSDVADFLEPFCNHYMWLVKAIMDVLKKY